MNKLSVFSFVIAVAALVSVFVFLKPQNQSTEKRETSYERVIRTQTLRCGYGTWVPGVYKNLNTGKMEGLFVDLIEEMGKLSNLKIEWATETDWGQIAEAINSRKIDAFCAGMANDAARGKRLAYTNSLSYWTFNALVRADDNRFTGDTATVADLNKSDYSSAYSEGDVLETIIKNEFPNVKGVALPPLGTPADNALDVITRKTDFVIFPKVIYLSFEKENPGKLRYLKIEPPLRAYGNVIATDMDDLRLQQLLNSSVNELVNSGKYIQIMEKYDKQYPGAFLKIKAGYDIK